MSNAPIALFCYKRVDTLQHCISSLKSCPEASLSDLVIFSDAPQNVTDKLKVDAVRNFLITITGFQSVQIHYRETNLGVDYNLIEGIKYMASNAKRFIVVEDDLIVEPFFLAFLNSALGFYINHKEILSISAFNFIQDIPKGYAYDVYFAKRFWPWGWATWSDRIANIDWEISDKNIFLQSSKIQKEFNRWGSDRSRMLSKVLTGKMRTWDIRLDYNQFKADAATVFPIATLVRNIGYTPEDATHTFVYNRYKTNNTFKSKVNLLLPFDIVYDSTISKSFIKKNSLIARLSTRFLRYLRFHN